jgi:hypothetical protein
MRKDKSKTRMDRKQWQEVQKADPEYFPAKGDQGNKTRKKREESLANIFSRIV